MPVLAQVSSFLAISSPPPEKQSLHVSYTSGNNLKKPITLFKGPKSHNNFLFPSSDLPKRSSSKKGKLSYKTWQQSREKAAPILTLYSVCCWRERSRTHVLWRHDYRLSRLKSTGTNACGRLSFFLCCSNSRISITLCQLNWLVSGANSASWGFLKR